MAFGHASLPTRKYAYGVRLAPHDAKLRERFEGFDALMDQMRRAHRFQNALVECELKRRADTEAALRAHDPNLVALYADAEREQEEINRMRAELSAANSAARKLVADPEQAARTRQQATVSAAAWRLHQQARAAAFRDPLVRPALALVDEAADTAKALARTEAVAEGLYWATSLQVMGRVKKSGPPPRFSRWDGEETVSVQFQRKADKSSPKEAVLDSKGNPRIHPRSGRPMMAHTGGGSVSTADMGRANTICWISPIPLRAPYKFDPKKVVVHFRIGTNDDGTPNMVHLPTVLHRPLAEGAQVKWVHVVMRRVGTRTELRICFDLARPVWDHHPAGADRATEGVVAVSLGWRHIDGMVRVAEWVGDDGARGSVMIPEDLVRQWRYLEKLQSIRDKYFDQWKEGVLNFVRSVQATATGLPQEWIDRAGTLASWNSPARLAGLVWWWKDHRLPGDVDAYRVAEGELVKRRPAANDFYTGGRKQDKHLCDWQAGLRQRLIGWRKDFYRHVAIDLSYQYKHVTVAEIDWADIAEEKQVEDGGDPVSKTNRAIAACATLRDHLTRYLDPVTVPADGITVTCHKCDGRMADPGRGRWVTCERCGGEKMDRAENAAENLLSRYLAANPLVSPARV